MKCLNKNILVTGAHRSGTTWIGKTIGSSEQAFFIFEPFNKHQVNWLLDRKFTVNYPYPEDLENLNKFNRDYTNLLNRKINHLKNTIKVTGFSTLNHHLKIIKDFRNAKRLKSKSHNIIKDPFAVFFIEHLLEHFKVLPIFSIRHPAAFYYSVKKAGWDIDIESFMSQENLMELEHLLKLKKRVLSKGVGNLNYLERQTTIWNFIYAHIYHLKEKHPDFLYLRHEDVSNNPIKYFDQVFKYCGLELTDKIRQNIKKNTSKNNSVELTQPNVQNIKRNSKELVKVWKNKLSKEEIQKIRLETQLVSSKFYKDNDW
jgi:hypothetical protein